MPLNTDGESRLSTSSVRVGVGFKPALRLLGCSSAILSSDYYLYVLPRWLHQASRLFSEPRRREVDAFSRRDLGGVHADKVGQALVKRLFPRRCRPWVTFPSIEVAPRTSPTPSSPAVKPPPWCAA
jgi:hypothetical protein